MAQLPCIGLYKPCINLPFGDCAIYFDHGVLNGSSHNLLQWLIVPWWSLLSPYGCGQRGTPSKWPWKWLKQMGVIRSPRIQVLGAHPPTKMWPGGSSVHQPRGFSTNMTCRVLLICPLSAPQCDIFPTILKGDFLYQKKTCDLQLLHACAGTFCFFCCRAAMSIKLPWLLLIYFYATKSRTPHPCLVD